MKREKLTEAKSVVEKFIQNVSKTYTEKYGNCNVKKIYYRRNYLVTVKVGKEVKKKWLSLSHFIELSEQDLMDLGFKRMVREDGKVSHYLPLSTSSTEKYELV